MARTLRLFSVLPLVLAAACTATPPSAPPAPPPTPTPAPLSAPENPPDDRARMPLRPTPQQPESKFPPPQPSDAAEDLELLTGEMSVLLDGAPFPEEKTYDPKFPEARRIRYVAADASGPGDGSQENPWKDLQEALCKLEPGDRLLAAGIYEGAFRVAGPCLSGTAGAPIQVFARHAFLKPAGAGDVLTLERAHWQFWEMQIALLDSDSAGLVVIGADAHDVAVDQSHIYEGNGPAVRIGPGTARVTLSNSHIHQSQGVRIEAGSSSATLVNNHIHHNRSASVSIGTGEAGTAQGITIEGNRIHNDRGPALDLANCEKVTVSRNRLSNYRLGDEEEEDAGGEAVRLRAGSRDVTFESNSVLEATVAVRIGDPEDARPDPPEKIFLHHNYFENRLTAESTALRIDHARDVRFYNNVIDRYADPFVIAASGVQRVWIANNLVLEPKRAFTLLSPDAVAVFDYNVFGASQALPAVVAEDRVAASTWIKGHMPHSRLVPGAGLSARDLDRIVGFSAVDAGSALEGIPFRGKAPDIGVAER